MAVETLSYTYTSETEINRLIRTTDKTLNLDDDGDGTAETDALSDIINEATDVVNTYCLKFYEASAMADNLWVRRHCTAIACWLLSQRRGNAAKMQKKYDRAIEQLERVFKGEMQIPRLPYRANMDPALSNYVVDERHPVGQSRVQPSQSVGGTYSGQPLDWSDPGWFTP